MNSIKHFTAEEIKQLRQPVNLPSKGSQGWSKCQVEPVEVLKVFSTLRLKKGFVLRAYQFREGDNGNAVVWAMPEGSPFPSPKECQKLKDGFLESPHPPLALDDLMEVIECDGSDWSYLSASIFMREVNEFGALWHGCNWSTHEIIDKAPFAHSDQPRRDSEDSCPQDFGTDPLEDYFQNLKVGAVLANIDSDYDDICSKLTVLESVILKDKSLILVMSGLPPFLVPVVMRVYRTYSPCLEQGGA